MRRVRYSVAISLDGYIADKDGGFDWIIMDPDIDFSEIAAEFDTLIMGRKTYEITQQQPGPTMPGMSVYVISKSLQQEDCEDVILFADPADAISEIRKSPGKDIWLFGGGELFNNMLEQDLVDTVEVAVIPVLVGDGLPFLPPPASLRKLKLTDHRMFEKTGTVILSYDIVKNS